MRRFHVCITLGPHLLAAAGLEGRPDTAIEAVRLAVRRMDGANWVDIVAETYPPECPGWLILRRPHRSDTPDTRAWREMQQTVEAVALAAMFSVGSSISTRA